MVVFGWTRRGLTSAGFSIALAYSVDIYSHEPSSLFLHSVSTYIIRYNLRNTGRISFKFRVNVHQHTCYKYWGNRFNRSIKNVNIFTIKSITIKSKVTKTVQRIGNQKYEKSLNHSQTDIAMFNTFKLASFIFLILKCKKS